jgi:hypothetical protein
MQGRRLHGKKGDRGTAAAAPLTAGDPSGEQVLDSPAEGIHAGDHLAIVVEQIVHGPQVPQNLVKSKCQFIAQGVALTGKPTDTVASLSKM